MQLNPAMPSLPLVKPAAPFTTASQLALSPAVQAAQQTTTTVRTQTVAAPQAAGKSDQTRDSRSATQNGQSLDTGAGVLAARVNAQGYRASSRGSLLDVSV